MPMFKDSTGEAWDVTISIATARSLKSLLNIDLYGLINEKLKGLAELLQNPILLCDVLWVVISKQAVAKGVTDEEFGSRLFGDPLEQATEAFIQGLVDFFPDPKTREGLKKVLEKSRMVRKRLAEIGQAEIDRMDVEQEAQRIVRELTTTDGTAS